MAAFFWDWLGQFAAGSFFANQQLRRHPAAQVVPKSGEVRLALPKPVQIHFRRGAERHTVQTSNGSFRFERGPRRLVDVTVEFTLLYVRM